MIVRLFHGHLRAGAEDAFFDAIGTVVEPRAKVVPGLQRVVVGRPLQRPASDFVAVTVWSDLETLTAAVGPEWSQPMVWTAMRELVESAEVEHYETLLDWRAPDQPPSSRSESSAETTS